MTWLRRPAAAFALIGLIALVVRLAAIAATPDLPLAADPMDYDRHARTIAATGHYPGTTTAAPEGPSAIRPPAFPYLLGAVYAVTGDSIVAGRVLQAVLGALIAVLVALVALELFGRGPALVAGLLTAVFPPLVIDGMTLLSEPLFVALELAAVLAILYLRKTHRIEWAAVAGAATGAAALTRPNALAILIVLALGARGGAAAGRLRSWRAPAAVVACALLVIAPWTIRNADEFDSFIPVSTQDGYTLAGTYNATSRATDGLWLPPNVDPAVRSLLERSSELDEAGLNAELRSAARRFALDHPTYVVSVAVHNLPRLFNVGGRAYQRDVAVLDHGLPPGWGAVMTWTLLPVLVLAAIGLTTPEARRAPRWFWVLPLLLLGTVFVLAANRHRAAIDPFLLIAAALGILALHTRIRGRPPP